MDEPLSFPLEAGPVTASLEFIVGVIVRGDGVSTWATLDPRWVHLGTKDASVSWVRSLFLLILCITQI